MKECSLPARQALCIGAKVMLLHNFIVEYKIINGSIGVVRDIVYKDHSGPNNEEALPEYVIVDFPESTIPEEEKSLPNLPRTFVPVPVVDIRCEKKCCSMSMIPLIISIAITIHKSQGMTIGPNEMYEKLIYHFHEENQKKTPDSEVTE